MPINLLLAEVTHDLVVLNYNLEPADAAGSVDNPASVTRQVGHHDVRVEDAGSVAAAVDVAAADEHREVADIADVEGQRIAVEAEVGLARREAEVHYFLAGRESLVVVDVRDAEDLQGCAVRVLPF